MSKLDPSRQKAINTRRIVKAEVTILFILIVEFFLYVIEWAMNKLRGKLNPHLHVLVLMISFVLLFSFAIGRIESATNWLIETGTTLGTERLGRRLGVSAMFFATLCALYVGFYFFTFGKLPF
ncbi:MAG: hypothetical protein RMM16_11895, partial [Chloroherpetonaceae bacterium]|nr:hypothetical protein [Chloroherpetonaceae bacterium]